MNEKKRTIIAILLIALAVGAAVAGYLLLPDVLTVQIAAGGNKPTTMPKPLALLLPLILTTAFALIWRKSGERKNLIISAIGLVVFILSFALNL